MKKCQRKTFSEYNTDRADNRTFVVDDDDDDDDSNNNNNNNLSPVLTVLDAACLLAQFSMTRFPIFVT